MTAAAHAAGETHADRTGRPPAGRPARVWWAVVGLIAAHLALVLDCATRDFATFDEIGNLAAGLAYWETGSYRLYNVNPPVPKLVASLPVWLADPNLAALREPDSPADRPEWDVGDQFARDNSPRYPIFVVMARTAGVGWVVLAAVGVYRWATFLWGTAGGLVALAAWCFEPNVIAHGHLLNPDLPATAAGLWASYSFRSYLSHRSWPGAALAGLLLGLALACKYTLLVLCPLWAALWLVFTAARRPPAASVLRSWAVGAGQFALLAASATLVINHVFEYAGSGRPLGAYPFVSESLAGPPGDWPDEAFGNRFAGTWLGAVPVPLPENVLRGVDVQRRDFEMYRTRYSYLRGEWKQNGWWYYYLYAAAVKIPLGLWVLFGVSLVVPAVTRGRRGTGWDELVLLILPGAVLFAFVSTQTSIQSHFRYVLPAMPYWIIFLGRAGQVFGAARRWAQVLAGGALAWAVGSYLALHPYSLPYFNELAGGPDRGHDHLLGSNIDWGQDLGRLKQWLDDHPEARPIRIAYFNHIDPRVIGLGFELPPLGVVEGPPEDLGESLRLGPHPGWYAVSVRLVRGNLASPPDGRGGYRLAPAYSLAYFQRFRPVAKAGYSIFIYRITLDEANAVRMEYGLRPLPADGPPE